MFRLSNILSLDSNEDDDDEGIVTEDMLKDSFDKFATVPFFN
jgi:hypothetical protein